MHRSAQKRKEGGVSNGPESGATPSFSGGSVLASMNWYNSLRYQVVPPLFLVFFTAAVQWLALEARGQRPCPLDLSQCIRITGNSFSWKLVIGYLAWAMMWLRIPAKVFVGPESPEGHKPTYCDNGFLFYGTTSLLYGFAQLVYRRLSIEIYDNFPEILGTLNTLALFLCAYLLYKGRSTGGKTDSPLIYDFYRGTELHPRLLDCDVKQLAVSRVGMMLWQLLVMAFFFVATTSSASVVTFVLQTVYIAKFFWWETGYFTTLDVTYDRAGYYLVWGGMVWMPILFPLSSYLMIQFPSTLSSYAAFTITVICLLATILEYIIDREKEVFVAWRQNYAKKKVKPYNLWGKPVKFLEVKYANINGEVKKSALLLSGFWGTVRHGNYLCELVVSFLFCFPSAVGQGNFLPLLYFYFIAILIAHRVFRDEDKCSTKYGKYWDEYCRLVPYRMIPYVF